MRTVGLVAVLMTVMASSTERTSLRQQVESFTIPPAVTVGKHPMKLWATNYYVYSASTMKRGIPLLDMKGNNLGPTLSSRDWCLGGIEGTIEVANATYNFAGEGKTQQVDCKKVVNVNVGNIRYSKAKGPFGDGTAGFSLVPWRTIATDPHIIPTGTVLFIPAAVGQNLPNGARHDGFFFAADVGSKIVGDHIDVFTGASESATFVFVQSNSAHATDAFVIDDKALVDGLTQLHRSWILGNKPDRR